MKQKLWNVILQVVPTKLSKAGLIFAGSILALIAIAVFGIMNLEPHHISSQDAFLGNLYRGKLVPFVHDDEKAKEYLAKAVEKNNSAEAECDLGEIYAEEGNYKSAAHSYFTAAMYGSQRCEVHFLKLPFPDERQTFQFIKKIADERKYPSAYFMVGKRLIEGQGVTKDTKDGIAYLQKAVAFRHWGARLYLAGIYIKGELLPQDIKKANELMGISE